jgi:hypothetical protein
MDVTLDSTKQSPAAAGGAAEVSRAQAPGFFRRHRLPLVLAVIAVCIYAGSILWFVTNRGGA